MYNESFASILKVTSRAQAPAEGHLYAVGATGAYRPPSRIAPGSETKRPSPVPSPRGRPTAAATCRRDVAASPLFSTYLYTSLRGSVMPTGRPRSALRVAGPAE